MAQSIMSSKVYIPYNHTDSCNFARWNQRECYKFMYTRPWQKVIDFYAEVVKGHSSLSELYGTKTGFVNGVDKSREVLGGTELEKSAGTEDKSGRWARVTFKIDVSYHGDSFDGWQKQPGLNTVQSVVEKSLGGFVDEKKAQLLKDKCKPLEACTTVAGRTDKGVSALQQVCSFYTWRTDIKPSDIEDAINSAAPGKLRVVSVSQVSRAFHPNFSAKWRRYLYIVPLNDEENEDLHSETEKELKSFESNKRPEEPRDEIEKCFTEDNATTLDLSDENEFENEDKPRSFSVRKVNKLLEQLQGKLLSYRMFARDTKPSRNIGPPTECFIYRARAAEARLPCSEHDEGSRVMYIELVGNRFLRRMVRVLVATSIREAAAGAEDDALIKLMDATCRRATAPPAPPDGLCLVDVGYSEFDPENCFIP